VRRYGPYTTIYNRFNRWSRQGIWTGIFYALTGSTGMVGTVAVDSTHINSHQRRLPAIPVVCRPPAKFLMKKLPLMRWIWKMHSAGNITLRIANRPV
jgi:transposase